MANYLQRVMASGARTGVAERPPASVAPVVPMGRAPLIQPLSGFEFSVPDMVRPELPGSRDLSLPPVPAPPVAPAPTPQVSPTPHPEAAAVEAEDLPMQNRGPSEIPGTPAEPMPAASPLRAPGTPSPARSAAHLPTLTHLSGVTQGPIIQAPKAFRRHVAPPPAQSAYTVPNTGRTNETAPGSPAVEQTISPVREPAPVKIPHAASAARIVPPARVVAAGPEPRPMQTSPEPSVKLEAAGQPVPAGIPKPVPNPVQPQPPREAAPRAIAPVARAQNRIHIGRVDVQVNNRPAVAPRVSPAARPGAGVSQSSFWEALGLDRFAMKP